MVLDYQLDISKSGGEVEGDERRMEFEGDERRMEFEGDERRMEFFDISDDANCSPVPFLDPPDMPHADEFSHDHESLSFSLIPSLSPESSSDEYEESKEREESSEECEMETEKSNQSPKPSLSCDLKEMPIGNVRSAEVVDKKDEHVAHQRLPRNTPAKHLKSAEKKKPILAAKSTMTTTTASSGPVTATRSVHGSHLSSSRSVALSSSGSAMSLKPNATSSKIGPSHGAGRGVGLCVGSNSGTSPFLSRSGAAVGKPKPVAPKLSMNSLIEETITLSLASQSISTGITSTTNNTNNCNSSNNPAKSSTVNSPLRNSGSDSPVAERWTEENEKFVEQNSGGTEMETNMRTEKYTRMFQSKRETGRSLNYAASPSSTNNVGVPKPTPMAPLIQTTVTPKFQLQVLYVVCFIFSIILLSIFLSLPGFVVS
jgi:hypothetical protein